MAARKAVRLNELLDNHVLALPGSPRQHIYGWDPMSEVPHSQYLSIRLKFNFWKETGSMSYDRIWIASTEHPGGWLERRQAERLNLGDEFETSRKRLYAQGDFVVLIAGTNFLFDELFLFEQARDARDFYDNGFMKFESFIGDDDLGCGFEEISLYQAGKRVATKSCPPTKRIEAKNE